MKFERDRNVYETCLEMKNKTCVNCPWTIFYTRRKVWATLCTKEFKPIFVLSQPIYMSATQTSSFIYHCPLWRILVVCNREIITNRSDRLFWSDGQTWRHCGLIARDCWICLFYLLSVAGLYGQTWIQLSKVVKAKYHGLTWELTNMLLFFYRAFYYYTINWQLWVTYPSHICYQGNEPHEAGKWYRQKERADDTIVKSNVIYPLLMAQQVSFLTQMYILFYSLTFRKAEW